MRTMFRLLHRVTLGLATGGMIAACSGTAGSGNAATTGDPDAPLMAKGVDLLYKSADPVGAEAAFREVLLHNPAHYGAKYQLAIALDRGGKPADARPVWDAVLKNAQATGDSGTMRTASARLAAPDTASQEATMALGLDLMRRQNNPAAAADEFRKVLARNPTHYGANFQLATALDLAGKAAQAKPVWQRVLGMATAIKDAPTAQIARQHLAGTK